jgi:hypothetical protein
MDGAFEQLEGSGASLIDEFQPPAFRAETMPAALRLAVGGTSSCRSQAQLISSTFDGLTTDGRPVKDLNDLLLTDQTESQAEGVDFGLSPERTSDNATIS